MWHLSIFLVSLLCVRFINSRSYGNFRETPLSYLKGNSGYEFQEPKPDGGCGSPKLKCVPKLECELQCPFGFTNLTGGACYFVSQNSSVSLNSSSLNRTFSQGEDFCKSLGARLLWIEDAKELAEVIALANQTLGNTSTANPDPTMAPLITLNNATFFLNAEFSLHHGSWIWSGTHSKINWDILLFNFTNKIQSLANIRSADVTLCLAISLPSGLITSENCLIKTRFICKMGKARSTCTKSSSTKCCFSSTFNFNLQNREEDIEHGYNKKITNLRPDSCRMKVNSSDTGTPCSTVLANLKLLQNTSVNLYAAARIGSSYFYLANSTDACMGRNAIIENEEVHNFVMMLLATREVFFNSTNPVSIGLTFRLQEKKAFWVDGKPVNYYEQFWFPGEPTRDASVDGGCAAYVNLLQSAVYLWKLFPRSSCVNFIKLCELKAFQRQQSVQSAPRKVCGKRHERGVLARSAFSIHDSDESNFGEFPWQAAVMNEESRHGEVKLKFACSGALVHKQFVLTSAHCVSSMHTRNMVVALGLHDLEDFHGAILDPLVLPVVEVITHNHFNVKSSFKHDVALLQLGSVVNTTLLPHIGLVCLPSPEEIKFYYGKWECFVSGWSSQNHNHNFRRESLTLRRKEVEFTSDEFCRNINSQYYHETRGQRGYEQYKSSFNSYRLEDPELLCAKSFDGKCIGDSSSVLVCKKATSYQEKPFSNRNERHSFASKFDYGNKKATDQSYNSIRFNDKNFREDYIINAYGESRFNSDTWFIIGIGNSLSQCGSNGDSFSQYGSSGSYGYKDSYIREPIQNYASRPYSGSGSNEYGPKERTEVFTSVIEYMNFIHFVLDLYP